MTSEPMRWIPMLIFLLLASCSDDTTPTPDAGPPAEDQTTTDRNTVADDQQRAAPREYTIESITRSGTELIQEQATWAELFTEDLDVYSAGGKWLLILNVPDTWNDTLQAETWFSLRVDGKDVAQGVYSTVVAGQRMPTTLITVEELPPGDHTVTASWKSATADAKSYISAAGVISLIAMKVPEDTQFSTQGAGTAHTISGTDQPMGLEDLTLTTTEKSHYLLVMNAPQIKNDKSIADGGSLWYSMLLDGEVLAAGGTFPGAADQAMPMTLIGVKEVDVGEHTISAQAISGNGTATMGPEGKALLAAVRLPGGAVFQRRANTELNTSSPDWSDIADLESLSIDSQGDKHLLIFIAPDTWNTEGGGGPQFSINLDGTDVAQGHYWSGVSQQRVCSTIMTVADLPAGTHTIKARWRHPGPGTAYLGMNSDTWVIGLK